MYFSANLMCFARRNIENYRLIKILTEGNMVPKFGRGHFMAKEKKRIKLSTTAKVINALQIMLSEEKYKNGASYNEVWARLESIPALKTELYNYDGIRREGVLTGITTRIKNEQIDGIKVVKENKHIKYIKQ